MRPHLFPISASRKVRNHVKLIMPHLSWNCCSTCHDHQRTCPDRSSGRTPALSTGSFCKLVHASHIHCASNSRIESSATCKTKLSISMTLLQDRFRGFTDPSICLTKEVHTRSRVPKPLFFAGDPHNQDALHIAQSVPKQPKMRYRSPNHSQEALHIAQSLPRSTTDSSITPKKRYRSLHESQDAL